MSYREIQNRDIGDPVDKKSIHFRNANSRIPIRWKAPLWGQLMSYWDLVTCDSLMTQSLCQLKTLVVKISTGSWFSPHVSIDGWLRLIPRFSPWRFLISCHRDSRYPDGWYPDEPTLFGTFLVCLRGFKPWANSVWSNDRWGFDTSWWSVSTVYSTDILRTLQRPNFVHLHPIQWLMAIWVRSNRSRSPLLCAPPTLSWTWEIRWSKIYQLIQRSMFLLLTFGTFLLRLGMISSVSKDSTLSLFLRASQI